MVVVQDQGQEYCGGARPRTIPMIPAGYTTNHQGSFILILRSMIIDVLFSTDKILVWTVSESKTFGLSSPKKSLGLSIGRNVLKKPSPVTLR